MRVISQTDSILETSDNPWIALFVGAGFLVAACYIWTLTSSQWFFWLAFAGFGLFVIANSAFITTRVDKKLGKISIRRRTIFSELVSAYGVSEVKKVRLMQSDEKLGGSVRTYTRLALVLQDGQPILLNTPNWSIINLEYEAAREAGRKLAAFLGVPYKEFDPTSFADPGVLFSEVLDSLPEEKG